MQAGYEVSWISGASSVSMDCTHIGAFSHPVDCMSSLHLARPGCPGSGAPSKQLQYEPLTPSLIMNAWSLLLRSSLSIDSRTGNIVKVQGWPEIRWMPEAFTCPTVGRMLVLGHPFGHLSPLHLATPSKALESVFWSTSLSRLHL